MVSYSYLFQGHFHQGCHPAFSDPWNKSYPNYAVLNPLLPCEAKINQNAVVFRRSAPRAPTGQKETQVFPWIQVKQCLMASPANRNYAIYTGTGPKYQASGMLGPVVSCHCLTAPCYRFSQQISMPFSQSFLHVIN